MGNVCVLNSYIENPGTSIGKCMCTNFRNWDCWNWYWEHNFKCWEFCAYSIPILGMLGLILKSKILMLGMLEPIM